MERLGNIRNIGISAHIDSGKTTLTERILYYSGRIHRMQEVKDKDGGGATMDFMDLEKERGITITSAATTVGWNGKVVNIIDTPGHVDFTVEVERSLRVLDGAVLVLCAVGGVQSQSITVDRQMRRYRVPRIAFVNKMDRVGADPRRVINELESKLGHVAVPMQIPIGEGETFAGVIDLVKMKRVAYEGKMGVDVVHHDVPAEYQQEAARARDGMLDTLSLYDDELMGVMLEGQTPTDQQIYDAVRRATISRDITPILFGTAFRNKGVQDVLDAVVRYLPSPIDRVAFACDNDNEGAEITITADPKAPLTAMAFKICDEPFGQVTYTRIYQGNSNAVSNTASAAPDARSVSDGCTASTRTSAKTSNPRAPVRSLVYSASTAPPATRFAISRSTFRSRAFIALSRLSRSRWPPSMPRIAIRWPRHSRGSSVKIRPSTHTTTPIPARRFSPAWASCTSRCTSSGCGESTAPA